MFACWVSMHAPPLSLVRKLAMPAYEGTRVMCQTATARTGVDRVTVLTAASRGAQRDTAPASAAKCGGVVLRPETADVTVRLAAIASACSDGHDVIAAADCDSR